MSDCTGSEFEIIASAKQALLDSTNIESSPDEMKVLNDFLYRCWQMGWLDKYYERLPFADVVEVVRCKDCKHHEELLNNNDGNVLCWVHGLDVIVDRNGYCNYGEREEQEHER